MQKTFSNRFAGTLSPLTPFEIRVHPWFPVIFGKTLYSRVAVDFTVLTDLRARAQKAQEYWCSLVVVFLKCNRCKSLRRKPAEILRIQVIVRFALADVADLFDGGENDNFMTNGAGVARAGK
ncbi:MAG: hypothetical protein ACOCUY_00860 [Verrucomicrobiota bacterium]